MNSSGSHNEPSLFLGVDVGGTNIKIGVVDSDCNIIIEGHFPTEQERGPQHAIDRVLGEVQTLMEATDREFGEIVAAGLGTPGTMDIPKGMILEPPNLSGWRHFNVRDGLSDALGIPVTYTNDANAAAYGEFWGGSGSEFESLVLFTLGTGVGGGIITNDSWIDGAHSHGAEVGHILIDSAPDARRCGCGKLGCLEAYTSATAVAKRAQEKVESGAETQLSQVETITSLAVANAAQSGDELAYELVMETAKYLALGISTTVNIIDPAAVLLGGAMDFGGNDSSLGRDFLQRIKEHVAKWTFPNVSNNLTIDFATLGSAAGWIGAAGLSRAEYLKKQQPQTI